MLRWPFVYSRALLGAARGEHELVQAMVREMDDWATPRRIRSVTAYARQVGALLEVGRGDLSAAHEHARALCRPASCLPACRRPCSSRWTSWRPPSAAGTATPPWRTSARCSRPGSRPTRRGSRC
jgi:hypothetical protein